MKLIKIFLINLIIFFSLIVLIDIFFGTWFKNNFAFRLSSERNIDRLYEYNFKNHKGISRYIRDNNAFRTDLNPIDPKDIDVVYSGGSTTNQKFLKYDDTIVSGLQKNFPNIKFVNAGIDGLSIQGHINSFEYWFDKIKNFKPKIYIFYIGINDQNLMEMHRKSVDSFEESDFKNNIKENKLYGYDYNIVTYNIFNRKTRLYFNNIFKNIMKYFSIWLTFGKPITSGWLLATFIKFPGVSKFVSYFKKNDYYSYFWKYMTMGYDYSYMTDMDNKINKNNNIIGIIGNTITKILLYIFICSPILNLYNNTFFGLTFSPLYYNFIIQILFILNLTLNFSAPSLGYNTRSEIITLNILFFLGIIVVSLIVFIVYLIINYFRKK